MAVYTPDQVQAIQALLQQGVIAVDKGDTRQVPVDIQAAAANANVDNLSRILLLEGKVVQAALDQLIFRTAQGDFQLRVQQIKDAPIFESLPSQVTLQLRPGPDGLEAVLLVGGKAVSPDKAAATIAATATQTLAPEIPKSGQTYQALVLPSSLLSSLPQKEQLNLLGQQSQGFSFLPQAAAKQTAPGPLASWVAPLLQKLGMAPPPASMNTTAVPLPLANQGVTEATPPLLAALAKAVEPQMVTFKIIGSDGSDTPGIPSEKNVKAGSAAAAQEADDADAYTVTVRGRTPSGQTLLSLGNSLLAVKTARDWPEGTQLRVALGPLVDLMPGEKAANAAFPNLKQVLEVLALHSPGLVQEIMHMRIPQPQPAQMPGAMLFLFTALQRGDLRSWLGNDIDKKLEQLGRIELLQKLQDEWQGMRGQSTDVTGNEWRSVSIPWQDQDKLQAFRFYIHDSHGERQKEKDRQEWARRFLIDMSLSRMGPLQLEGLVHKKKLEIMVRTEIPLPEDLRRELQQSFHKTMEDVRYTGTLRFQANRVGWIEMKEKLTGKIMRNA
jgi:hypothetical protein